jgi:hypothetical protein
VRFDECRLDALLLEVHFCSHEGFLFGPQLSLKDFYLLFDLLDFIRIPLVELHKVLIHLINLEGKFFSR